ncbi:6701_t:CDS:2, partial [Entrophospora sp. SA101]
PGEKNGGGDTTSIFGRNVTIFPNRAIVYITKLDNGFPLEIQRKAIKSLWQQNVRNAKEISERLNIPLRSCERYVSKLRKTGNNSINHSPGRPRKLSPKKRHHIGKILKHNHFMTAGELKAKLEENDPELEVSERTVRHELKNLESLERSDAFDWYVLNNAEMSLFLKMNYKTVIV